MLVSLICKISNNVTSYTWGPISSNNKIRKRFNLNMNKGEGARMNRWFVIDVRKKLIPPISLSQSLQIKWIRLIWTHSMYMDVIFMLLVCNLQLIKRSSHHICFSDQSFAILSARMTCSLIASLSFTNILKKKSVNYYSLI